MRAEQYIKVGSPKLRTKELKFRGIGSNENVTLGEFDAEMMIENNTYPITIHVVSDTLTEQKFLIGTDFLNRVEINIKKGDISINPSEANCELPEIFEIDVSIVEKTNKVDVAHVPKAEHKKIIEELAENYEPLKSKEVGIKMSIVLKDDEPVYQRARRLSPSERDVVNAQIREWINEGIAQPSLSEYASPVVLVKKKDGSHRLCVDYRQLNKKIIKDRYPLPLIEDQLDALQGAKYFSTLDLKNGFFHVQVDEPSRKFTAFIVPDGHYEFLRVPFGLCNSPSVFQRYINAVFKDLIRDKVVLTYMDDLIIPSTEYEDGIKKLEIVLSTACEVGLHINWEKCRLLQSKVEFLGHIVENGQIRPSEHKTEAVRRFPEPKNARQVQSFLGLSGYFRKFIPHYSLIARPLSNLLKADVEFTFGAKERDAFIRLKETLIEKPVLNLYKVGVETQLHTDACMYGYGAILLQKDCKDDAFHPVYYASGKTTPAEQNYTSYELEVLAIVKSLKKFRVYLLGISFKIVTDCRAFALTMNKRDLCVRVARWALLLEEFDYTIEHRPGKLMMHVDALSRHPLPSCLAISECEEGLTTRLKQAQWEDRDLKRILELAEQSKITGYEVRGGLLFKEVENDLKLVVPKSMTSQIIRQMHERGHFSVGKTEALVRKDYWIPNIKTRIERVIQNCIACILAEKKRGRQEGYLNCIDKGEMPLDTYHVDHLGPLPSTKKSYKHIFVVVDSFSKFVWLYATKTTNTADVVTRLRKQSIIFGNPRRIISDRGTAFTSREFAEYCKEQNIEHLLTTTGTPRSNGQVERVNRTLIPLLTKLADPKKEEWFKYLEKAQQYLNITVHRSVGTTPFQLLFGTQARMKDDHQVRELLEKEWAEAFQSDRDELRERAKESIAKVQSENRKTYNKKRTAARSYQEDDLVAIKRVQQGPGLKLANKFLGPYRVIRVMRNDRYVVQRVGEHEGPMRTSTAADYMKPWINEQCESECESEYGDIRGRMSAQDGRV